MKIPVYFELKDFHCFKRDSKDIWIIGNVKNNSKMYFIKFNADLYNLANRQSQKNIRRTRESLTVAIDGAIRSQMNCGMFDIYLDKGAFDIAD